MPKLTQFMINILKLIDKILRYSLIYVIRGLRPLFGPASCKHPITCTDYAEETLRERSFIPAVFIITKRVLCCNPFMDPK